MTDTSAVNARENSQSDLSVSSSNSSTCINLQPVSPPTINYKADRRSCSGLSVRAAGIVLFVLPASSAQLSVIDRNGRHSLPRSTAFSPLLREQIVALLIVNIWADNCIRQAIVQSGRPLVSLMMATQSAVNKQICVACDDSDCKL